ncbi:MAG TPA: hypothetical protein DEP72_05745 [Clostridiales bacterium]|nr:hypothetical protein [Clostridiales bacterium]
MNIDLSTYEEELPSEVKLTSYATNANILLNVSGKGLLLIYDSIYDMLYPFCKRKPHAMRVGSKSFSYTKII